MNLYGITFLFKVFSFSLFNSDLFNGCNVLWKNAFSVVISILKFSNLVIKKKALSPFQEFQSEDK